MNSAGWDRMSPLSVTQVSVRRALEAEKALVRRCRIGTRMEGTEWASPSRLRDRDTTDAGPRQAVGHAIGTIALPAMALADPHLQTDEDRGFVVPQMGSAQVRCRRRLHPPGCWPGAWPCRCARPVRFRRVPLRVWPRQPWGKGRERGGISNWFQQAVCFSKPEQSQPALEQGHEITLRGSVCPWDPAGPPHPHPIPGLFPYTGKGLFCARPPRLMGGTIRHAHCI